MKAIHFVGSIDQNAGGIPAYIQLLGMELKKLVRLQIVTGVCENPVDLPGIKVQTFDFSFLRWFKLKNEFRNYLKAENPQLVHINGIWNPQNYLFQEVAKSLKIKVIISPHGMLEPYILKRNSFKKRIAMLLYQKGALATTDYLLTTAKSELNNIRKLGFNQPAEIIPNGLDVSLISKKGASSSKNKFFNILFLSRVHPKKGIEILIEALSLLQNEEIKVIIAGEGEPAYITSLIKLSRTRKVEDKITFLGGVYGQEKWKLYDKANLFVLPTHSENFGIVIIEALAAGIPVITTKGTPWEELETYHCGWWIDLDIENLACAIKDAFNTPLKDLMRMGERGRQLVETKYDNRVVAREFLKLYNTILKN